LNLIYFWYSITECVRKEGKINAYFFEAFKLKMSIGLKVTYVLLYNLYLIHNIITYIIN